MKHNAALCCSRGVWSCGMCGATVYVGADKVDKRRDETTSFRIGLFSQFCVFAASSKNRRNNSINFYEHHCQEFQRKGVCKEASGSSVDANRYRISNRTQIWTSRRLLGHAESCPTRSIFAAEYCSSRELFGYVESFATGESSSIRPIPTTQIWSTCR